MHRNYAAAVCGGFLVACAQAPRDIAPSYISPFLYDSLACEQIAEEFQRVSHRAEEVAGVQSKRATGDAVAMGVGLVLFWPSLFFIKGDKQSAGELARLKGELEALQQASVRKNCGLEFRAPTTKPPTPPPTPPA